MEPEEFTFQSVKEMTGDFSEEQKIGAGSYGAVYKGLSKSGKEVAVKKLFNVNPELNDKQFQNEFNNLKMLRHKHIIQIIGYCYETEKIPIEYHGKTVLAEQTYRTLCMEYMHNGSLQKHLSDNNLHTLDWHTRFKIIKGICKGLKYLHEDLDKPIYHLDLKPDNILLNKEMVPKLADFGLSRIFSEEGTRITSTYLGTIGYLPPEFIERGEISKKFDVFSLGVIMIEIVSGPEGYYKYSDMAPEEFVNEVHEKWRSILQTGDSLRESLDMYCEQVKRCTQIALNCLEKNRHKRPKINDILYKLDRMGQCCCQQRLHMVLFLHQFLAGHTNRTEEFAVGTNYKNGFGSTVVQDWAVTTTADPNGMTVARAQGLHMQAGQTVPNAWYTTFNLVFLDERYADAGSTLQVMGTMADHYTKGEWSIVGGTGTFRRAKGTIEFNFISSSTAENTIRKLDIEVFYTGKSV